MWGTRYSCQVLMKFELCREIFEKIYNILNFMEIRPEGEELFHADRRKQMTKLMVGFRNYAKAPKDRP